MVAKQFFSSFAHDGSLMCLSIPVTGGVVQAAECGGIQLLLRQTSASIWTALLAVLAVLGRMNLHA